MPIYDQLIKSHQFVPNPVLWKADLLFKFGKDEEAKACVQEATTIDPVAGYEYRAKLYDLMSQILKQEGDKTGSAKYANQLLAVQLGLKGSRLKALNLNALAAQEYRFAVAYWPQDTVSQSDLADCLESLGQTDEAREHREDAFLYLPASMGESSRGPEVLYNMCKEDDLATSSLGLLDEIVKNNPKDAEAYYARAMINSNLGFSAAESADLLHVVSLDPNHVGAWESLDELARGGILDPDQAQKIEFRLFTFHPDDFFGAGGTIYLEDIGDLRPAYPAVAAWELASRTPAPVPFFPLHVVEETDRSRGTMRYQPKGPGEPVGELFQRSRDIQEIISLFHPTRFPYE